MPGIMIAKLSTDEIDDLLYFTRVNDETSLEQTITRSAERFSCTPTAVLTSCVDPEDGNTPLHFCAANGFTQLLSKLLKLLNDDTSQHESTDSIREPVKFIDHRNGRGNTPLHWASYNGHLDTVKALVAAGADMWVKNASGHLALFEAEQAEKNDVVQFLLEAGGTTVEQTGNGATMAEEEEETPGFRMTAGDVSQSDDALSQDVSM